MLDLTNFENTEEPEAEKVMQNKNSLDDVLVGSLNNVENFDPKKITETLSCVLQLLNGLDIITIVSIMSAINDNVAENFNVDACELIDYVSMGVHSINDSFGDI